MMKKKAFMKATATYGVVCSCVVMLSACGSSQSVSESKLGKTNVINSTHPGELFDLSEWNITLPQDANNDNRPDIVRVSDIQRYTHPDFFFLNENNEMVFRSPNVAVTTANSKNARSELRRMSRGTDTSIGTKTPGNNMALASHPNAQEFAAIGGKMEATLKVNHVALNSSKPYRFPSYSVVIGQIHAGKDKVPANGFGYGNEPLKIYYKKHPNHETGSVFWTYERNLEKDNPDRRDIVYPVWGNTWENMEDPKAQGVALGESFSYVVNVHGDVMHLTFSSDTKETVQYSINLANNVNAYGEVDEKDFELGYLGDWHYFKAGAYSQCNGGTKNPFWGTGCDGTGEWDIDFANGDYSEVVFSRLVLSESEPVE